MCFMLFHVARKYMVTEVGMVYCTENYILN